MTTTPLVFGRGLDRDTGRMARSPDAQRDARNMLLDSQSMRLRKGIQATGWPVFPWGTDCVCMAPHKLRKDWLFVLYDRATRELRIYKANPSTITMQLVASWGTMSAAAVQPPVILAAEHSDKVFFAHSERNISARMGTVYYTPPAVDADPGTLTNLTADLDLSGVAEHLKFRGVLAVGAFLMGWGYGNATSPDEPAMLRVSFPGKPLDWPEGSFVIFGGDTDPIVAVASANDYSRPVVAKANEIYALAGSSPADWQPVLLDDAHGVGAARLMHGWRGQVWIWDAHGPVVTDGTSSPTPIDDGLGVDVPSDLPAIDLSHHAFMVADEEQEALYVLFPDATTPGTSTAGYLLSMRGDPAGWTYVSFPFGLLSAARGPTDKGPVPNVTGYASAVSAVDGGVSGVGRRLDVAWTNNAHAGDEVIEIWLYTYNFTNGLVEWVKALSVNAIAGASQSAQVPAVRALQSATVGSPAYNVALRFTRGVKVLAGYEGADPAAWAGATVAGSRATFTTLSDTPVLATPSWSRTSAAAHQHAMTWTASATAVSWEIEVAVGPTFPSFAPLVTIVPGAPYSYARSMGNADVQKTMRYRVRAVNGANVSAWSATRDCWTGPPERPTVSYRAQFTGAAFPVTLMQVIQPPVVAGPIYGGAALALVVEENIGAGWVARTRTVTEEHLVTWVSQRGSAGATNFRMQYSVTTFGVADRSDYHNGSDAGELFTIVAVAAPTQPPPAGQLFGPPYEPIWNPGTGIVTASFGVGFGPSPNHLGLEVYRNHAGAAVATEFDATLYHVRGPYGIFQNGQPPNPYALDGIPGAYWPTYAFRHYRRTMSGATPVLSVVDSGSAAGVRNVHSTSYFYATSITALWQPTPGVGTIQMSLDHNYTGAGADADSVLLLWRDNSSNLNSWQFLGTVTPPTTTATFAGIPLGITIRVRAVAIKNSAWQWHREATVVMA